MLLDELLRGKRGRVSRLGWLKNGITLSRYTLCQPKAKMSPHIATQKCHLKPEILSLSDAKYRGKATDAQPIAVLPVARVNEALHRLLDLCSCQFVEGCGWAADRGLIHDVLEANLIPVQER